MITETATVLAVDGDKVTLEAAIKSTCSTCQAQSDCGSGVISRALAPRMQQITLTSPVPVKVGDQVKVGIPEAGILGASLWLYLMPLLLFVISAGVLHSVFSSSSTWGELITIAGSVATTSVGFVMISGHLKRGDQTRFTPVLLSVITPASVKNAAS
ncbi:SoxR reducing system RseC family protein [Salinimonas sp. HHU 13199]|uniref:SoxR reducing system RseC family protein n=1 Tax=Salinimonas profundi TaxID=2729140 RepID=A0ABR8LPR8_9ALTE|nr:SoxR reducing system RseC family protein [Salinimonas profundi]MBD3587310.1 SoxR reducing system RseC family protein [Salinimonas profundi]